MAAPQFRQGPSKGPVDYIISMRNQGLSTNQITQTLQQQGYGPDQIFEAMNQVEMQSNVTGGDPYSYMSDPNAMQNPMRMGASMGMGGPPGMDPGSMGMGPSMDLPPGPSMNDSEKIEQIVESLVEEKWNAIMQDMNKVIEWKEKTESRMTSLEQQFKDLKDTFDKLHQAIIGKINEYDQNIIHVGTEIKAMEKVFQKVLPELTGNIQELSRITKTTKENKTEKKGK